MVDLTIIRTEIARLALSSRTRTAEFTNEVPCKWNPQAVPKPNGGGVFSDAEAWQFIIDLLEINHPIEVIDLDKPPGKKGYVLLYDLGPGLGLLYIKLQIGKKLIGRSFHLSEYS